VNHGFFNQYFLYRILAVKIRIYGKGLPSNDERSKKWLLLGAIEEAIQHLSSLGLPNVSSPTFDDLIAIFLLTIEYNDHLKNLATLAKRTTLLSLAH
jgi:hypothetical protein